MGLNPAYALVMLYHCVQFQRGIPLKEILCADLQALENLLGDFEWLTYDYYIELQAARVELQLTELGEASGLTNWKPGTVLEIIYTGCVLYVNEALYPLLTAPTQQRYVQVEQHLRRECIALNSK